MRTVYTFSSAVTVFGAGHLRRMVRRGVWQKPATNVYVTHNGPLTAAERFDVALAAWGPPPCSAVSRHSKSMDSTERDRPVPSS